jgi:peptidoglycan hydrolase CwlO-like protein
MEIFGLLSMIASIAISFYALISTVGKIPLKGTVAIIILAIVITIATTAYIIIIPIENQESEISASTQITKLDEIQNTLADLQNFISTQKESLIKTEKTVKSLRDEKEKLEPIVKADKELVMSIIELQQRNQEDQIWKDRSIGFFLGIVSSLIGSSIFILIRKKVISRN